MNSSSATHNPATPTARIEKSSKMGALYLIPTNLSAPFSSATILPPDVVAITSRLNHFIAENAKTARLFLKSIGITRPMSDISIVELDKHGKSADLNHLLAPLIAGDDMGLVSEAGAPAIADPGASVVAAAHRAGVVVRPLVGPSSILLGLMASGLNGQTFAFHGYLPQDKNERSRVIQALERESKQNNVTQMFIETPYRNQALMQDLVASLNPNTTLCIATDLTGTMEYIRSKTVSQWRTNIVALDKLPTMFLFLA
ncbi:MAG: SAM-dependent methyltransferase [Pseudomonadota bacterium]